MSEFGTSSFFVANVGYIMLAGSLLCSIGLGIYSFKKRSTLLKISAICFFVFTSSYVAETIYPFSFTFNATTGVASKPKYRPSWVSPLTMEVSPVALVIAGLCILGFALRSDTKWHLTTQSRGPPHGHDIQIRSNRRPCVGPLFWLLDFKRHSHGSEQSLPIAGVWRR